MKAYKVFETQNFERGIDPKDSMEIGDVTGRLLKIRRAEAIQAMEEVLKEHGGSGPFFLDQDDDETGFKIAILRNDPIFSKFKINDFEARYYIEFNVTEENFFVGWEQEKATGKWMDRQWTSKVQYGPDKGDIKTIEQAKQELVNFINGNQPKK